VLAIKFTTVWTRSYVVLFTQTANWSFVLVLLYNLNYNKIGQMYYINFLLTLYTSKVVYHSCVILSMVFRCNYRTLIAGRCEILLLAEWWWKYLKFQFTRRFKVLKRGFKHRCSLCRVFPGSKWVLGAPQKENVRAMRARSVLPFHHN